MATTRAAETRDGVELTSLDGPLFDGAASNGTAHTKRDLVDYLDTVRHAILPAVAGRALSVVRVRPGQQPFMQKNLPRYAPDWIARTTVWAEASHREIAYPLCDDRRTLLWLANQRAVEYHPALIRAGEQHASYLVLDLDPPEGDDFGHVVQAAMLVRRVLDDLGLVGAVKTSGSKGVHIFVPITPVPVTDSAAATRATGIVCPCSTSSAGSSCGSGRAAAHGSPSPSSPGAVATVKSPGRTFGRSSQATGNDTGSPGRTRGL